MSGPLSALNGVHQDGVLSPLLFLYTCMDGLLTDSSAGIGYHYWVLSLVVFHANMLLRRKLFLFVCLFVLPACGTLSLCKLCVPLICKL